MELFWKPQIMSLIDLLEAFGHCPYCNESISVLIDPSLPQQQYIEDCEVCCRPITVNIQWLDEDNYDLKLLQENEVSCG